MEPRGAHLYYGLPINGATRVVRSVLCARHGRRWWSTVAGYSRATGCGRATVGERQGCRPRRQLHGRAAHVSSTKFLRLKRPNHKTGVLQQPLARLGVLSEDDHHRFGLTTLGEALKTGAPGSARSTILALAGEWWWRGWEQFDHSLATGTTGMQKAFGMSVFEYLASHPHDAAHFNEAMIGFHGDEPPAVAAAMDFSTFGTVVDVVAAQAISWLRSLGGVNK